MKQSFDNRQISIKQGNSAMKVVNSTKKQSTKAINITQDNINFNTFDTG